MKNLIYSLGKKSMLPLILTLFFFSCKKSDSSIDELRYRKYWTKKPVTTPVDTSKTTTGTGTGTTGTGTGTTGTGTGTTGTGTGTTGTGTGTGTTTGTRANLTFESTFDGVSISGMNDIAVSIGTAWSNQQHLSTWGVSAAPISRAGSGAVKFDLRPGDAIVSGSYRSEITGPDIPSTEYEGWWGMSFYPVNLGGNDLSVVQWHSDYNNGQGTPPLGLWVTGGKWCVVRTLSGWGSGNDYGFLGAAVMNKWTDFVFHIKFSTGSGGVLEVWQDGTKVYSYTGVTNFPATNYMKTGIYQWDGITGEQIMYADEFRIGNSSATYNDVKPG